MFNSEHLLYDWRKSAGCCGFCGTHYTTLTDNRILSRYEEYICCGCCCDPPYKDSSIFLYDVAQLIETTRVQGLSDFILKRLCICYLCCCRGTKNLELRGSFGYTTIFLASNDALMAKPAIAEAIARHKPHHT